LLLRDAKHGRLDLLALVPKEGGELLPGKAVRHLIRIQKGSYGERKIVNGHAGRNARRRRHDGQATRDNRQNRSRIVIDPSQKTNSLFRDSPIRPIARDADRHQNP